MKGQTSRVEGPRVASWQFSFLSRNGIALPGGQQPRGAEADIVATCPHVLSLVSWEMVRNATWLPQVLAGVGWVVLTGRGREGGEVGDSLHANARSGPSKAAASRRDKDSERWTGRVFCWLCEPLGEHSFMWSTGLGLGAPLAL